MDEAKLTTVMVRVKKLLSLAQDGRGNENEMANAAAMAQKLMTEYNLTVAAIERVDPGSSAPRVKDTMADGLRYDWKSELVKTLTKLNFCLVTERFEWGVGNRRRFKGYEFIGREANVATIKVTFEYLIEAINRLVREEVHNDHSQFLSRYANSFRAGCAFRLGERLRRQREEEIQEEKRRETHPAAATVNALIIRIEDYVQDEADLNRDFRMGLAPGSTKRQREESAANYVRCKAREAELVAAGRAADVAWRMAFLDETPEEAERQIKKTRKPETEAERVRREKREAREDASWYRRQARERNKHDHSGFERGREAGDKVSLNRQADHRQTNSLDEE